MIKFGTAGIREENLSKETVAKVVQAICETLPKRSKILVGRDTRESGEELCETAIQVLFENDMDVFYIERPIAISLVSSEIKNDGGYKAGLYFSASHNPAQYNGIKIFNSKGRQIDKVLCQKIEEIVNSKDYPPLEDDAYGYNSLNAEKIENDYIYKLGGQYNNKVKLLYNCGYGTGRTVIPKIIKNIEIIEATDRDILTTDCDSKLINPENLEATNFDCLHVVVATDPDCDRIAVCEYGKYINGHDMTALLLDYLMQRYPEVKGQCKICKSKVTSLLAEKIAEYNGIDVVNTNVGFNNISKYVDDDDFLLGAEESCGYLMTSFTNDKCGISSLLVISEMIDYWDSLGIKLNDRLSRLKESYLNINECTSSETTTLNKLLDKLKDKYVFLSQLNGTVKLVDINNGNIVYIRQSGTEKNKCKVYFKTCN